MLPKMTDLDIIYIHKEYFHSQNTMEMHCKNAMDVLNTK